MQALHVFVLLAVVTVPCEGARLKRQGKPGRKPKPETFAVVDFSPYPGDAGGDLSGKIMIKQGKSEGVPSQILTWYLKGTDDNCPMGTGNVCGIHIHVGRTCKDHAEIGGHLWNEEASKEDPWTMVRYSSSSGKSFEKKGVEVITGLLPKDIIGRSVVVHNSEGAGDRFACGIIKALPGALVEVEEELLDEDTQSLGGENCGASMSVSPRYCVYQNRMPTCSHSAVKVGEIVPLRIRVRNMANYEDMFGNPVYVPARIPAGTMFQIVFACSDTNCPSAFDGALEFVSFESDTEPSSVFKPGPAPGFKGLNKCDRLANANTACGYITIGNDIQISSNDDLDIGVVTMRAKSKVPGRIVAHVAADAGALVTTGGICHGEVRGSGAGTTQAAFA